MAQIKEKLEPLKSKSVKELRETLTGQKRILADKKLLQRLPDKGSKIQVTINHIESLISSKYAEEEERMNEMTQQLGQSMNIDSPASVCDIQSLPEELRILENRPSTKVINEATEDFSNLPPRYLPNRTTVSPSNTHHPPDGYTVHKHHDVKHRDIINPEEPKYPAVLLPEKRNPKCFKTQSISVAESYQLQKEQYNRLKAYQMERATAKLAADSDLLADSEHCLDEPHKHYEGEHFTRYRDDHSSGDEELDQVE